MDDENELLHSDIELTAIAPYSTKALDSGLTVSRVDLVGREAIILQWGNRHVLATAIEIGSGDSFFEWDGESTDLEVLGTRYQVLIAETQSPYSSGELIAAFRSALSEE